MRAHCDQCGQARPTAHTGGAHGQARQLYWDIRARLGWGLEWTLPQVHARVRLRHADNRLHMPHLPQVDAAACRARRARSTLHTGTHWHRHRHRGGRTGGGSRRAAAGLAAVRRIRPPAQSSGYTYSDRHPARHRLLAQVGIQLRDLGVVQIVKLRLALMPSEPTPT